MASSVTPFILGFQVILYLWDQGFLERSSYFLGRSLFPFAVILEKPSSTRDGVYTPSEYHVVIDVFTAKTQYVSMQFSIPLPRGCADQAAHVEWLAEFLRLGPVLVVRADLNGPLVPSTTLVPTPVSHSSFRRNRGISYV